MLSSPNTIYAEASFLPSNHMNSFQASHWLIPQMPPYAWVVPALPSRSSLREALKQGGVPNVKKKTLRILRSNVDLLNYPFNYNRESQKEAGIVESTIGGHIVTRIQWTLSSGAEVNYSVVQQWLLMPCYCSNCSNNIATATGVQKFI